MIEIDGSKSAANGVDRPAIANQNDRLAEAKQIAGGAARRY